MSTAAPGAPAAPGAATGGASGAAPPSTPPPAPPVTYTVKVKSRNRDFGTVSVDAPPSAIVSVDGDCIKVVIQKDGLLQLKSFSKATHKLGEWHWTGSMRGEDRHSADMAVLVEGDLVIEAEFVAIPREEPAPLPPPPPPVPSSTWKHWIAAAACAITTILISFLANGWTAASSGGWWTILAVSSLSFLAIFGLLFAASPTARRRLERKWALLPLPLVLVGLWSVLDLNSTLQSRLNSWREPGVVADLKAQIGKLEGEVKLAQPLILEQKEGDVVEQRDGGYNVTLRIKNLLGVKLPDASGLGDIRYRTDIVTAPALQAEEVKISLASVRASDGKVDVFIRFSVRPRAERDAKGQKFKIKQWVAVP